MYCMTDHLIVFHTFILPWNTLINDLHVLVYILWIEWVLKLGYFVWFTYLPWLTGAELRKNLETSRILCKTLSYETFNWMWDCDYELTLKNHSILYILFIYLYFILHFLFQKMLKDERFQSSMEPENEEKWLPLQVLNAVYSSPNLPEEIQTDIMKVVNKTLMIMKSRKV